MRTKVVKATIIVYKTSKGGFQVAGFGMPNMPKASRHAFINESNDPDEDLAVIAAEYYMMDLGHCDFQARGMQSLAASNMWEVHFDVLLTGDSQE